MSNIHCLIFSLFSQLQQEFIETANWNFEASPIPSMPSVPCYTLEFFLLSRKGILDEYSQITSLVTEEIVNVHKEIQTSVEQIDPNSEYNDFIDTHRYTFSSWCAYSFYISSKPCIELQYCLSDQTWICFSFPSLLVKLYHLEKLFYLHVQNAASLFNRLPLWLVIEKQNPCWCYCMWKVIAWGLTVDCKLWCSFSAI